MGALGVSAPIVFKVMGPSTHILDYFNNFNLCCHIFHPTTIIKKRNKFTQNSKKITSQNQDMVVPENRFSFEYCSNVNKILFLAGCCNGQIHDNCCWSRTHPPRPASLQCNMCYHHQRLQDNLFLNHLSLDYFAWIFCP